MQLESASRRNFLLSIVMGAACIVPLSGLLSLILFPLYKNIILGYVPVVLGILIFYINDKYYLNVNINIARYLNKIPVNKYLISVILISIFLRIPFVILARTPFGDHLTYFQYGKLIAEKLDFSSVIFYPPGPFAYTGLSMILFNHSPFSMGIMNCIVVSILLILVYKLGSKHSESVGRFASLFVACMPSIVVYAGGYGYENILMLLLCLILFLVSHAYQKYNFGLRNILCIIIISLLCGISGLIHPPYLLLIVCIYTALYIYMFPLKLYTASAIVTFVLSLAVIFPWTYRNWIQYNEFCLISANGGTVLLSSNNPNSDGIYDDTYIKQEVENINYDGKYEIYSQVKRDKYAMKKAIIFIANNPVTFLKLSLKRIVYMWGTDTSGHEFIIGNNIRLKNICSFLSQITWTISLIYWSMFNLNALRHSYKLDIYIITVQIFIIFKYVIHAVVEPLSRHHLDIMPIILIFAAIGYLEHRSKIQNVEKNDILYI